jgi:uncharacterized protein YjdB
MVGMAMAVSIKDLLISPRSFKGFPGDTVQLMATATFTDDTQEDVTNQMTWESSNPAVGTVSVTGLVTIVAHTGNFRVTGRFP